MVVGAVLDVAVVRVPEVCSPEVCGRWVVDAGSVGRLLGIVGMLVLVWVVVLVESPGSVHLLVAEGTGTSVWGPGDGVEAVVEVPGQWLRSQQSTRTL